jgi:hypothetical protein
MIQIIRTSQPNTTSYSMKVKKKFVYYNLWFLFYFLSNKFRDMSFEYAGKNLA